MNTSSGPVRGLKFWCARKTQPWRAMCSFHQLSVTKAGTQTPELTATLNNAGAGLPGELRYRKLK